MIAAGCDDFVRKPFQEQEIFDMLQKHLGLRYVYEEPAVLPKPQPPEQLSLDAAALSGLPPDILADLRVAANTADLELTQLVIAQIRNLNAPLADALAELVNQYRFDTLLTIIQE